MLHQFGNLCYHMEEICEMGDVWGEMSGGICLGENVWGKRSGGKCLG